MKKILICLTFVVILIMASITAITYGEDVVDAHNVVLYGAGGGTTNKQGQLVQAIYNINITTFGIVPTWSVPPTKCYVYDATETFEYAKGDISANWECQLNQSVEISNGTQFLLMVDKEGALVSGCPRNQTAPNVTGTNVKWVNYIRTGGWYTPRYSYISNVTTQRELSGSVQIVFPTNTTYNYTVTQINYTSYGINYCWYSTDGGASNSSVVSAGTNFTGLSSTEGNNTWTVYCNDTSNVVYDNNVTFEYTPPPSYLDFYHPPVLDSHNAVLYGAGGGTTNKAGQLVQALYPLRVSNIGIVNGCTVPPTKCYVYDASFTTEYANGNVTGLTCQLNQTVEFTNGTQFLLMADNSGDVWSTGCPRNLTSGNITGTNIKWSNYIQVGGWYTPRIAYISNVTTERLGLNFTIAYPQEITYNVSQNVSEINYTYAYNNPQVCRATTNGGSSYTSPNPIGTNFTGLISNIGENNWTLFCNDTTGFEDWRDVSFTVSVPDPNPPDISIIYPANTTYNYIVNQLNYSHYDLNPNQCWYSKDNGVTNSSPVSAGTNFTSVTSTEGSNTWTLYCDDTFGNLNMTSVTFYQDSSAPSFNIIFPTNNKHYNDNVTSFNYTYSELQFDTCWYSLDDGATNNTLTCGNNITGINYGNGNYTFLIAGNDTVGYQNYSTVYFVIDEITPDLTWYNPSQSENPETNVASYQLSVKAFDTYLDAINVSVYNATDDFIYTNFTGNLTEPTFYINDTIPLNEGNNKVEICGRDSLTESPIIEDDTLFTKRNAEETEFILPDGNVVVREIVIKNAQGDKYSAEGINLVTTETWIDGGRHYKTLWELDDINDGFLEIVMYDDNGDLELLTDRGKTRIVDKARTYVWRFDDIESFGYDVEYDWNTEEGKIEIKVTLGDYIVEGGRWIVDPIVAGLNTVCENETITLDTIPPVAVVTNPLNKSYNANVNSLEYIYNDGQNCWFSDDGGTTNTSYVTCGQNYTGFLASDGSHTWTVYINDSAGNQNSTSLTFFVDTVFPVVNIVYPINTNYNYIVKEINYTYTELNPFNCWYSIDYGVTNTSWTCGNNVSGLTAGQGTNVWKFTINDTAGNMATDSISFVVDTVAPTGDSGGYSGSGTTPTNNSYTKISPTNFTVNVTDNITGIANITLVIKNESDDVINETTVDTLDQPNVFAGIVYYLWYEGIYKWFFKVYDVVSNLLTTTEAQIIYDVTNPLINLQPINDTYSDYIPFNITFYYNVTELNIDSCWYNLDDGANYTLNCSATSYPATITTSGNHTLNVYINDSVGLTNADNETFEMFFAPSSVSLSAISDVTTGELPVNISISYSISGNSTDSCWYSDGDYWSKDSFAIQLGSFAFGGEASNFTEWVVVPSKVGYSAITMEGIAKTTNAINLTATDVSFWTNGANIYDDDKSTYAEFSKTGSQSICGITGARMYHTLNYTGELVKNATLYLTFNSSLSSTALPDCYAGTVPTQIDITNFYTSQTYYTINDTTTKTDYVIPLCYGSTDCDNQVSGSGIIPIFFSFQACSNSSTICYLHGDNFEAWVDAEYYLAENPRLEIGNADGFYEWRYNGYMTGSERTDNLRTAINEYIDDTGNYSIPFTFYVDSGGLDYYDFIIRSGINGTLNCSETSATIPFYNDGYRNLTIFANNSVGLTANDTESFLIFLHYGTQQTSQDVVTGGMVVPFDLKVELTDISHSVTASLVYNDVEYPADSYAISGNTYTFEKELAIPKGLGTPDGNVVQWYWRYTVNSPIVEDYNTTAQNQTVYSVEIDDCTNLTERILNLTMYDEGGNTVLSNVTNPVLEAEIKLISWGDESLYWQYNNTWNTTSAQICVPDSLLNYSDYRMDVVVGYVADNYAQEFWFLDYGNLTKDNEYLDTWTTKDVKLRDLLLTDSTTFKFIYYNDVYQKIPNAIVTLLRKYIGEGEFREAERGKHDNNGETALHLVEEDVIYKFRVTLNGELLYESGEYTAKCLATPCTVTLQETFELPEIQSEFDELPQGTYSLTSSKATRQVNLTFNLNETGTMNLTIYQYANDPADADVLVSSNSGTAKSGTVVTSIPVSYGNRTYYAVVRHNGEYITSEFIDMNESGFTYFGTLGIFIALILILLLGLIAVSEGVLTVVFVCLGLIISGVAKLINLDFYLIIWFVCLGGVIIYKLASRRNL